MSITSNDLLKVIQSTNSGSGALTKLAVVSNILNGSVYLTFYGDETPSQKSYKRLSSYTPTKGDTVLVLNVNGSYVIVGKVV